MECAEDLIAGGGQDLTTSVLTVRRSHRCLDVDRAEPVR